MICHLYEYCVNVTWKILLVELYRSIAALRHCRCWFRMAIRNHRKRTKLSPSVVGVASFERPTREESNATKIWNEDILIILIKKEKKKLTGDEWSICEPCNVCKLDTAVSIIFSDIIVAWIIAILLFTYLPNVRIFIRRMKITFGHAVWYYYRFTPLNKHITRFNKKLWQ